MLQALRANPEAIDNIDMPQINIKRSHTLDHATARQRAEKIADKLKSELNAQYSWDGDHLKLQHAGAEGSIHVGATELHIQVKLPFLLRPLRASIEKAIHEQLEKHL